MPYTVIDADTIIDDITQKKFKRVANLTLPKDSMFFIEEEEPKDSTQPRVREVTNKALIKKVREIISALRKDNPNFPVTPTFD